MSWNKAGASPAAGKSRDEARAAEPAVRTEDIRQRMMAHFERHGPQWIEREATKLRTRSTPPRHDHPVPLGMARRPPEEMIRNQARWTIASRMTRRLSALSAIEHRMTASPEPQTEPLRHIHKRTMKRSIK